jgi:hypothetical protein
MRFGQPTTMVVTAVCCGGALVAVRLALLLTDPQVVGVVVAVTWMLMVAPGARVPMVQVSVVPVSTQLAPGEVPAASRLHDVPVTGGRVSVTVTPLALPAVDVLVTWIT